MTVRQVMRKRRKNKRRSEAEGSVTTGSNIHLRSSRLSVH